jgi:hypothetical protein
MATVKRRVPFILVILFLVLVVIGINLGDVSSVFEKAIRVCLSCMGIG